MLFKMLGRERAWQQCCGDMHKPRQLFVTQSRVLADRVEEYFSKLMDSLATGAKSREELAALLKARKSCQETAELADADDDVNWRSDLPDRFSRLRDDHFPLFITFDMV
jgi:hypothetical protein